ncbi:hypothetical protein [Amycolatopsis sp. NPDC004625]|uniref:hypothetical protein n=1 Tax=Amycolatopsis sp. NPDC004625 TaxID=3154670 RepID=UPI0033A5EFE6
MDQPARETVVLDGAEVARRLRPRHAAARRSTWSGKISGGSLFEFAPARSVAPAERPVTHPEIVDDYRRFVERVPAVLRPADIGGVAGCRFLVSVSEDALVSFHRSGVPVRDAFDSAFTTVVPIDPFTLDESRQWLARRTIGIPEPFVCLCHCLSAGLPRDLERVAIRMYDIARSPASGPPSLAVVVEQLVRGELLSWAGRDVRPGALLELSRKLAPPDAGVRPEGLHRFRWEAAGLLYWYATLTESFGNGLDEAGPAGVDARGGRDRQPRPRPAAAGGRSAHLVAGDRPRPRTPGAGPPGRRGNGMGYVVDVPVRALLEVPLPPDRGGYAALAFVVSRAGASAEVHTGHLADWASVHDVTGRHLAVITPDPRHWETVDDQASAGIRGFRLAGDSGARLIDVADWRRLQPNYAPRLPLSLDRHADAVSLVASELQEHFGIGEPMLPCLAVVCTAARRVVVVELGRGAGVYELLRRVKSALQPDLGQLRDALAEARRREEAARELAWWVQRAPVRQEWESRRASLTRELTGLAEHADLPLAEECRWTAERLLEGKPLSGDERGRVDALLARLGTPVDGLLERRRSLLRRRLGRAIDIPPEVPAGLAGDAAELDRQAAWANAAHRKALTAAWAEAAGLDVFGAVCSAAELLGCHQSDAGLLPPRGTPWTVTAFVSGRSRFPA